MMKQKIFLIYILGVLFPLHLLAEQVNKISVGMVEGRLGKEMSIPVSLINDSEIIAIQLNISFPEGVKVDASSVALTDRKEDHTLTLREVAENEYLLIVFSPSNKPIRGNSGEVFEIPVVIPRTWEEGGIYEMAFNQVILSTITGENVATDSDAGFIKVLVEPRPDIVVESITADKTSFSPTDNMNISWVVKNIGDEATQDGWREQISLVNDEEEEIFLGILSYEQLLGVNGTVSRQTEFSLPELMGIDGNVTIKVRLIPDENLGELPAAQENNIGYSDNSVFIDKYLKLELPAYAIPENSSSSIICKLFRTGSWKERQEFILSCDDSSRLNIPSTVTIPVGQSGAIFYINAIDNDILDMDSVVMITVEGNGYETIKGNIQIEDDEIPALYLSASQTELQEGDIFTLTIEIERILTSDLSVSLACDHSKRFDYPSRIIIPAGEKNVEVSVTAIDDNVPDLTISAEFTVVAPDHITAQCVVILYDDDLPEISLSILPETVNESAGPLAATGVIRRLTNSDSDVTIHLTDDSNGGIYYSSSTLQLKSGVEELRFTIGVVDNAIVDGDREIEIKAAIYLSSCSCSATETGAGVVSANLTILDDDGPALKLTSSQTMLLEGKENATVLTVSRNTLTEEELVVNIFSDQDEELIYEHQVVIPVGQAYVEVPVSVKANDITEGDRTVTFTAVSEGYTNGICWVMITDQTLPDAIITELLLSHMDVEAGSTIDINITVKNDGVAILPAQTKVNLYLSNSSNVFKTLYTQKALSEGESETLNAEITLPDLTGEYFFSAIVNEDQTVKELLYINNNSEKVTINLLPKYTIFVSTDKLIYKPGESVKITGKAEGSEVSEVPVEIYIINSGIRQTLSVTTDSEGNFEIVFQPLSGQSGHFIVGGCYPGQGLTTEQSAFDIYGLKRTSNSFITCEILLDEPYEGIITLSNLGNLALTGITTEILSIPENCEITFDSSGAIEANGQLDLKFILTGKSISETSNWEEIELKITSSEGAEVNLTLYYYCRSPKAQLKTDISSINTTMIKGSSRDYSFTVTNVGKGETGKITLSLPQSGWITNVTPKEMASLESGESTTIRLFLYLQRICL